MTAAEEKYRRLKTSLKEMGSAAVAFSGGVDSTFLLKVAHDVLGDNVIAVTAHSYSFPKRESEECSAFCKKENITHITCDTEELDIEGFSENPVNRCYLCKREIFTKILAVAKEYDTANVLDGSNADDVGDYRPGRQAVAELGVRSPLCDVGLNKQEIRELSKGLGLPTWNKQPFACLYTRFPYGTKIDKQRLEMVDRAEQFLIEMGFSQVRVRYHSDLARIETDAEGFKLMSVEANRRKIHAKFKDIGFTYVSLDVLGYRTGSMNENL
ncbi:GMP synthase [glutamine-hydrolyzing] subunit B [Candidatus Methanoplasma termitum]|uniref:GuaAB1 protein n=1 Tax=Candidatus Methanoplasma termitum TaxID=1577791 RepID=A0A0A7LCG4_9ARCH|nr:ATP-dependent sacrificial sulfur transferase LarE [Candidatus Methanoplasma termitum]AIZ56673.1 GMP synthase [glutamine-hydrolyzing] subunit B [Candidatus Methanoplasma termitum]